MSRLLIHVEGQTEETFVNEVLCDHLLARGFNAVSPRILGNARERQRRGGITPWPNARKNIVNHLREDSTCFATTMVDYYALPEEGKKAWPGRKEAASLKTSERGPALERALLDNVAVEMGSGFNPDRFIPFVVMHEFEGLLFSDCGGFSRGIGKPHLEAAFQEIRDQFATPEDINDSPVSAPSKRVENLVQGYQKPLLGVLAALEIGLSRIRQECPHFGSWLARLESRVSGY